MIVKQRIARKLKRLEEELSKLRKEIEESKVPGNNVSLRGKYSHLGGLNLRDIQGAKEIWKPGKSD